MAEDEAQAILSQLDPKFIQSALKEDVKKHGAAPYEIVKGLQPV